MKHPIFLPSRKEATHGWQYLAFSLAFLGYFLSLSVRFLNLSVSSDQINLVCFCLNFLVAVILFRNFLQSSMQAAKKRITVILITAAVSFFVYYLLTTLLSLAIIAIEPSFFNVNNANLSGISRNYYWQTFVCTVILVPVAEELFYRGAIFGGLYKRSRLAAYLVSAAIFALAHILGYIGYFSPLHLLLCYVQYLPAGFCLAAAYDITGNIATPILIHTAINAVGILAMR